MKKGNIVEWAILITDDRGNIVESFCSLGKADEKAVKVL